MTVKKDAKSMMDALGITEDRCAELCTAIEKVQAENKNWELGEVLDYTFENICQNRNEERFVMYIFGKHQGIFTGMEIGKEISELENALSTIAPMIISSKEYRWRGNRTQRPANAGL